MRDKLDLFSNEIMEIEAQALSLNKMCKAGIITSDEAVLVHLPKVNGLRRKMELKCFKKVEIIKVFK